MVKSEEELKKWLGEQPREVCVAIAARAALRALPRAFRLTRRETAGPLYDDPLEMHFRAGLTACVAAVRPSPEIVEAAKASTWLSPNLLVANELVFNATAVVALEPIDAARQKSLEVVENGKLLAERAEVSGLAFGSVDYLHFNRDADAASADLDIAVQKDSQRDAVAAIASPLWYDEPIPNGLRLMWEKFRDETGSDSPWWFWKTWYQGFLDGKPLDWELQRQIALIPSKDWQRGAEHIALIINEIQARHEVRVRAEEVRALLAEELAPRHGIGHNQPPEPMDDEPLTAAELLETEAMLARVLDQVSQRVPDKAVVAGAAAWIQSKLWKATVWFAKKCNVAAEEFAKKIGSYAAAGVTAIALAGIPAALDGMAWLLAKLQAWLPFLH